MENFYISNINTYSKSLSWGENLNFPPKTVNNSFKFSAQDSDLDNVLSAPIFLEYRSAPAPCQKKECHSHFAPFNKKEWHSSLALSKKSALFSSIFLKEKKFYLTEDFLWMLELGKTNYLSRIY